ncbi:UNVERIFIED_CONTAM: hypothetical protein Sangu_2871500 [Sesamum angustifolium]|uniref:Endonuclease/exonuclease/phosphatase domain-containing protein n=1 Tax=Sesamum angustifolium TaxID=2727405 RepID=A0AAW2INZ7_9LAMI
MIKVAAWNVRGLNGIDLQRVVEHLVRENSIQFISLIETRVNVANVQRVCSKFLTYWSWFYDYNGPAGRIWRNLWATLHNLADNISEEPWLVLGDFNDVIDDSEINGRAADTTASMTEFRNCIMETCLIHLPFTGCPYTWHNCSEGSRSLWKRLDRMRKRGTDHGLFRFDNYLAKWSGFIESVNRIWKHKIPGTAMYEVVSKLKALKSTFRQQQKATGNLSDNVKLAKGFLDKAQELFSTYKEDVLLHLVKCCRMVYSVAVKMEENMLHQRSKLQ